MKAKKQTKGVLLLSFGKRGYAFAAYNMAYSIKHFNPEIKVTVLYDDCFEYLSEEQKKIFDSLIELPKEVLNTNGKLDPGKVKVSMYDYIPYDNTLYLDVDGLCLKDIEPLIDTLSEKEGFFYSVLMGKGGKKDSISYAHWATNEDVWKEFGLKEDATYYSLQSSVCFIKKGSEAKKFFAKVKSNYLKGFPTAKKWGGTLPDELFFSGTLSQEDINPDMGFNPIFFGNTIKAEEDITNDHYILSLFGNGNGGTLTKLRYIEWYDRLMKSYTNGNHVLKSGYIMSDKHLNNKGK